MMKNEYYIDEYCESRGLKPSTRRSLGYVLNHYSDFQGLTLHELLEEADDEEEQGIRWKRRTLKHRLIAYMNHCKQTMSLGGAKTYFGKVKGFYTHHEIEIGQLPRWNTKNANITSPILPEDLPTKSIIRQAIEISNPLMRAIITTLISTGLARADLLRLTVDDLLSNTYEHHQKSTIQEALPILSKSDDIICTLKGRRYKNNKPYITFLTPEAITEICNYLLIRDKRNHKYHRPLLQPTDPLFKISPTTYGDKFVEINNTLKLGTRGTYNRFRGHMLRKYHATTLEKDGMSREHIRILQGKANSKVDEAYFYTDTETLRNEFIQHMDGLLIFTETKKIDQYSPEYAELKKQNKILLEKEKQINKIWDKVNNMENRQRVLEELRGQK